MRIRLPMLFHRRMHIEMGDQSFKEALVVYMFLASSYLLAEACRRISFFQTFSSDSPNQIDLGVKQFDI
jgi:hypothetical protein